MLFNPAPLLVKKTLTSRQPILALALAVLCALAPSSTARAQSYTLTINTLGSGSVSASPAGPYAAGTMVTLTATASSGSSFSSWSGNLTGYANPSTVIMNGNYTVTATFDQNSSITGDSRTVTEPVFPAVCTVLMAQQSASSLNQSLFDTTRLQTAINNCPVGRAVELSASGSNNAFLTQPIVLKAGVTLLVDAEVTLFGSNNYSDYNCTPDACTPLINVAANTGTPGSAIMGYGIIDGQGSFCYDIARGGDRCPRMIYVGDTATHASSDNFTLYKITLQNSPNFNFYAISNGLTVWGVKVTDPNDSPNTDGIDPSASSNVTIRDSYVSDGDDHIAIKAGLGHVSNVTITHNHFYSGHGISVGSETNAGANNILVTENVIDQNGCAGCSSSNDIRIKSDVSRGGEVKDVLYRDLCIRNASTQPHEFVFNPFYDPDASGSLIPYFHDIHLQNVHMVDAGNSSTFQGFDATRPLTMSMDNVVWDAYNSSDFTSAQTSNAQFTLGPGKVNFASDLTTKAASDTNVTVINNIPNPNLPATYDCTGRFVYLAGELTAKTNSVTAGQSFTLTAILQTIISPSTAPTGTISILEGTTVVASATRSGRLIYITIPGVSLGTHRYTAQYSGDINYAPLNFGSFTLTAH
jgi:polygalacturonase